MIPLKQFQTQTRRNVDLNTAKLTATVKSPQLIRI